MQPSLNQNVVSFHVVKITLATAQLFPIEFSLNSNDLTHKVMTSLQTLLFNGVYSYDVLSVAASAVMVLVLNMDLDVSPSTSTNLDQGVDPDHVLQTMIAEVCGLSHDLPEMIGQERANDKEGRYMLGAHRLDQWSLVGQVAMVRGLLAHTPIKILLLPSLAIRNDVVQTTKDSGEANNMHQSQSPINQDNQVSCFLIGCVFPAMIRVCGDNLPMTLRRLGFRNLVMLLETCHSVVGVKKSKGKKVKNIDQLDLVDKAREIIGLAFSDETSPVITAILQLVWEVYDEQGDSMARSVHQSFSLLLDIHVACALPRIIPELHPRDTPLVKILANKIIGLDWRVRGRYPLLATLFSHVGALRLAEYHPGLQDELLDCLEFNHLTPPATEFHDRWLEACVMEWEMLEKCGGKSVCDQWKESWNDR
eukprot:Ihof_evm3s849 gene=Ihof_evmTU3s849